MVFKNYIFRELEYQIMKEQVKIKESQYRPSAKG